MKAKDTRKYYEEIFNHSGESYHMAMQLFPHARDQEFQSVIASSDITPGNIVVDVPAGGGYLKPFLSKNIDYRGFDFSENFSQVGPTIEKCQETRLPLAAASVDHIICLAALHHVEDKPGFFQELSRILKPEGQLIIADVVSGSAQDIFLNQFVDRWKSIGHAGEFIDFSRDQVSLKQADFSSTYDVKNIDWIFNSKQDAVKFCRLLFSLDLNPSDTQITGAIDALGGKVEGDHFRLSWQLSVIKAIKV